MRELCMSVPQHAIDMKRFQLLVLLLTFALPLGASAATITLISNTAKGAVGGAAVTTDAIDTTGATLLVIAVGWYNGSGAPIISDSKGNTWTALTAQLNANTGDTRLYYSANPTVGTGHTFSNGRANYSSVAVSAWSGAHATPFDVENGAIAAAATSKATGSVTPSEDNELVIAGISLRGSWGAGSDDIVSIDNGFTISNQIPGVGNNRLSVGMAYLVQTAAAAVNPSWSWSHSDSVSVTIATFKAVASSPPPATGSIPKLTVLTGQLKVLTGNLKVL